MNFHRIFGGCYLSDTAFANTFLAQRSANKRSGLGFRIIKTKHATHKQISSPKIGSPKDSNKTTDNKVQMPASN